MWFIKSQKFSDDQKFSNLESTKSKFKHVRGQFVNRTVVSSVLPIQIFAGLVQ